MAKSQIEGMKELKRSIRKLGQVPQKSVTKAARAGANVALKAAKKYAPEDEGDLKSGLVLKGERRSAAGKKVYQVTFDPKKNDRFVKVSKEGKRSYYPASQEFGYLTPGGGYIPGFRYLRRSIEDNKREIEKKTVDVLAKDIDKALKG